jgi:hypothetical protein
MIGTFKENRYWRVFAYLFLMVFIPAISGCGSGSGSSQDNGHSTVNLPPVAQAGAGQTVVSGDLVTLQGSASSDPEGKNLSYSWTQASGTEVVLSGDTSVASTFTAPDVAAAGEDLIFSLTVIDDSGQQASANTTVHVSQRSGASPVANPGPLQNVLPGDLVILDGSQSVDPDGWTLTYAWSQTSGTSVVLSDTTAPTLYIHAPSPAGGSEALVFSLTVTNSKGLSNTATVTISVATTLPVPSNSTTALIDDAVTAGTITAEKGLTYKVFALFGDSRLPDQYKGASGDMVNGTGVMMEVAEKYETMSEEARTAVYPFLLPAYVDGSWYQLETVQQTLNTFKVKTSKLIQAAAAPVWKSVGTGKVKVWYEDGVSVTCDGVTTSELVLANGILAAAEGKIWTKLHELMEKEPLSDAGMVPPPLPSADYGAIPGNFDGSGALDIILCRGMNASGYTNSYHAFPSPAFITLDCSMWPLGDDNIPGLVQITAHEMMHAWQDSYSKIADPLSYYWLMEATAAWTEDYVYPKANSENRYAAWFLDTPQLTIDDQTNFRQYGLYTIFSYWTNGDNGTNASMPQSVVKMVWENTASMSSLLSVDNAYKAYMPSYLQDLPRQYNAVFELFWADSLAAAWNRGATGYFFEKDKLSVGAKAAPAAPIQVSLGGAQDKVYFLDDQDPTGKIELPYLSGRYYHFVFTDDAVRTVMFYDGLRSNLQVTTTDDGTIIYVCYPILPSNPPIDPVEGNQWRLIAKIDNEWKVWEPPQGFTTGEVTFCRDAKAERLQELVVVLANTSPDKTRVTKPAELAPLLLVSNIGTWGWDGSITATHEGTSAGDPSEDITATVQFRRGQDIYPGLFPASLTGKFVLKSGGFVWNLSGEDEDCTSSGSDAWSWTATGAPADGDPDAGLSFVPEARSGKWYRAFEGRGDSGTRESTYTITCPESQPPTTDVTTKPTWWISDGADGTLPEISADGTTLSGEVEYQDITYKWNLHSVREP